MSCTRPLVFLTSAPVLRISLCSPIKASEPLIPAWARDLLKSDILIFAFFNSELSLLTFNLLRSLSNALSRAVSKASISRFNFSIESPPILSLVPSWRDFFIFSISDLACVKPCLSSLKSIPNWILFAITLPPFSPAFYKKKVCYNI